MSEKISSYGRARKLNHIEASRKAALGNHAFPDLGPETTGEVQRVRKLLESVGRNLAQETETLSRGEKTLFVSELADRSRELAAQERQTNLLLGRLINNGSIPLSSINPDGTFAIEKLSNEPYFQENPHMIEVLNLRERQLAENSKTRKKAAAQQEASTIFKSHAHTGTQRAPLPRWWKYAAVGGNLVVGAAELAIGRVDKLATSDSVTALIYDGAHNASDVTYGAQAENITNETMAKEKREKRRKLIYQVIFISSILAAAKSGYHIFQSEEQARDNFHAVYAGGASLALNTVLGTSMYRSFRRERQLGIATDENRQDIIDHMKYDFAYALSAFGAGLFTSKNLSVPVEEIFAFAISLLSANRYMPTAENLAKAHTHSHAHGHHHEHHHHHQKRTRKPKRVARAAIAMVSIPLALGGVFGTAKVIGHQEHTKKETISAGTTIDDRARVTDSWKPDEQHETIHTKTSPTNLTVLFEKKTVQPGETFWEIGKRQIRQTKPEGNWVNPKNGVARNDVLIDLSRDSQEKTGIDLNKIVPGATVSFAANISPEDIALVREVLETTSYEDYKKLLSKS